MFVRYKFFENLVIFSLIGIDIGPIGDKVRSQSNRSAETTSETAIISIGYPERQGRQSMQQDSHHPPVINPVCKVHDCALPEETLGPGATAWVNLDMAKPVR